MPERLELFSRPGVPVSRHKARCIPRIENWLISFDMIECRGRLVRLLHCWDKSVVVEEDVRLNDRHVHALVATMHLSVVLHAIDQPRLFPLSEFCP